ncbi:hypothetical protein FRC17_008810 [Serendipita sp. 399]|nr:hypothetical protein FRC17_008810 [Serendipita sp. 399]
MSGHHGHDCHDEHSDQHTHSHDVPLDEVPRETLWGIIDHTNVVALNVVEQRNILKPWEDRNDEEIVRNYSNLSLKDSLVDPTGTQYLESDADDQMIIRIPFTDSSAKLVSILVKAGPGEQTPAKLRLFVNKESLDFDDVEHTEIAQELDIPQSREVGEYQLKPAKFSNVRNLAIFVPAAQGSETTRIYYLGFTGSFTKVS